MLHRFWLALPLTACLFAFTHSDDRDSTLPDLSARFPLRFGVRSPGRDCSRSSPSTSIQRRCFRTVALFPRPSRPSSARILQPATTGLIPCQPTARVAARHALPRSNGFDSHPTTWAKCVLSIRRVRLQPSSGRTCRRTNLSTSIWNRSP